MKSMDRELTIAISSSFVAILVGSCIYCTKLLHITSETLAEFKAVKTVGVEYLRLNAGNSRVPAAHFDWVYCS